MRTLLFILVSFVALTAFPTGLILVIIPDGSSINLPLGLLEATPFKDYRIPGILLAFVIGGSSIIALVLQLRKNKTQYNWCVLAGVLLTAWILVQMLLIRTVDILHIVFITIGVFITLIAYQLKGKWIV